MLTDRQVSDRLAIAELIDRYAAAVDDKDWAAVRACFADDAACDYSAYGGPAGSPDELVAWLSAVMGAVAVSQHLMANKLIEVDGDEASARVECLNPIGSRDGDGRLRMLQVGGRYLDRYVRAPDGWRIAARTALMVWSDPPIGGAR